MQQPEEVPDPAEAGVVGRRIAVLSLLRSVSPHPDRVVLRAEREEDHRADAVADVGEDVGPLADQQPERPLLGAEDQQHEDEQDHPEHQRVRRPDPRPAAVVLVRVLGGLEVDRPDVQPVHVELGEVGREAAEQDRQVGDADLGVLLQEVALELVGGPAHRAAHAARRQSRGVKDDEHHRQRRADDPVEDDAGQQRCRGRSGSARVSDVGHQLRSALAIAVAAGRPATSAPHDIPRLVACRTLSLLRPGQARRGGRRRGRAAPYLRGHLPPRRRQVDADRGARAARPGDQRGRRRARQG